MRTAIFTAAKPAFHKGARTGLLFAFLLVWGAGSACAGGLAVLPFRDQSRFKGPWKIGKEFPRALSEYLTKHMVVIPYEKVEAVAKQNRWRPSQFSELKNLHPVAQKLGADVMITGKIEKFHLIKKMAGHRKRGGYKHYTSSLEVKFKIYDAATGLWKEVFRATATQSDEGLRMNLPGKVSKDEEAFHNLDKEPFGSEAFKGSVAGKVVKEVCREVLDHLRITPREAEADSFKTPRRIFEGKVIALADTLAYVNLGFDDTISVGERFPVIADGDCLLDPETGDTLGFTDKEVGVLEISFIKARHLCNARIVKGKSLIAVGNRVRVTRY